MNTIKKLTLVSLIVAHYMAVAQTVPGTISYQGILMQTDGMTHLSDGPHTILFKFYTVPSGGTALTGMDRTVTVTVTTTKGLFTCIIGGGTAPNAPFSASDMNQLGSQQVYIGITVDGGSELTPRAQTTPATYALQAQTAYTISDAAITTSKIANAAVTNLKLGSDIDATKITAGTLSASRLPSSAGSVGRIVFWSNPASTFSNDAGLFWDNTNKRLGIGTSTPSEALSITNGLIGVSPVASNAQINLNRPSGAGISNQILFSEAGTARWTLGGANIGSAGATDFSVYNYGLANNAFTILAANNNVGIGTTSPNYKLDVRGGAISVVNSGFYTFIGRSADPGTNESYFYHTISSNFHILGSNKNGTGGIKKIGFALGGGDTEADVKVTIDNTGNLGVGTTTPSSKLHVVGNGLVSGSLTSGSIISSSLRVQGTISGSAVMAVGPGSSASGVSAISIGTLTDAGGDYSTALGVLVSTNARGGAFIIGDNSALSTTSSSADNQMTMRFAGGYRLFSNSLASIGVQVTAGGNSWSAISDSTKKENFKVVDGESVLKKINKFRLGTWNYKGQSPRVYRHYGPMAQDFFAAFGHDGVGIIGNDSLISSADFDGINFIAIQALEKRTTDLQKAVDQLQELGARIEALIAENSRLKESIRILEGEQNRKQGSQSDKISAKKEDSIRQPVKTERNHH